MTVSPDGTKRWVNEDGKRNREDGPAVILSDGSEMWYKNGFTHREDGPAAIFTNGSKFWYRHGKLHREDGPAAIYSAELKEWFLNHKHYSFTEWADKLNLDQKTKLEMVLKWNPKRLFY